MNQTDRRSFLKTGITSTVGLTLAVNKPHISHAGVNSLSGTFDILGLEGKVNMSLTGEIPDDSSFIVSVTQLSAGKALARIRFKTENKLKINRFSVEISIPLQDMQRIWYTQQLDGLGWHSYIGLPWGIEIPASGHQGCLLAGAQNRYGRNRGLVGLKNQDGDGSLGFRTSYGGYNAFITINRFAEDRPYTTGEIDETLYLDIEDIPWYKAVSEFTEWYDRVWDLSYDTPDVCYEPVWNTWYPSLGKLSEEFIERNVAACKDLGFKSFIIDDGWTKVRGGDWVPNTDIFSDFKATIRKIKSNGLNAILYYRPFHLSKESESFRVWERYRTVVNGQATDNLCPRCSEVQKRAGQIAGDLMRTYGLDGLKIDFLDASPASAPLVNCEADHDHNHDFVSTGVQEAMRLMAEEVRKVKHDAIIEYRINYSNIATRRFANCHRGQDTPSDPDLGRRHLTIIRSWCKGVATHSDPSFWSPTMSDENVARYMATIMLYAVPTMSINFSDLPKSHLNLIRNWLKFYHEHKHILRAAQLEPISDDPHYSAARITSAEQTIVPVFLKYWPSVTPITADFCKKITLFNGTSIPRIITRIENVEGTFRLRTTDIMLREMEGKSEIKSRDSVIDIDHHVPIGGILILNRIG